ncbi:MAG: histidine ammonia-lyase [Actinobacteria bacterium]|nr:histidine ammonia-lyase [Actinomycetota bacterium]
MTDLTTMQQTFNSSGVGPEGGDRAVVLDGRAGPAEIHAIARGATVSLDAGALEVVDRSHAALRNIVDSGAPIYGVTTGFGALVEESVAPEFQRRLQVNLLRSHAAGTGDPLPREVVRAAIAIRLNGLLQGHSGIRRVVLERTVEMLNAGHCPVVPRTGSLGASGDLAPSAHAFLPLLGEGEVLDADGVELSGAEALARLGREPLALDVKEGLALINGTHFMAAIGVLILFEARELLDAVDATTAVSIDALRGATPAFDPRVHELRPIAGQAAVAAHMLAMLEGSERVSGPGGKRLQDAYSLRCSPQVHGSAREAFGFFEKLIGADIGAVTDNPLVFSGPDQIISAGNFHGQPLSLAFDVLRLALADLAQISERRVFRLVSPSLNGPDLPAFLSPTSGESSGYMIAQYSAAAVVAEIRALATPVSIDNVPTSDNQEDHVSMGMTSALLTLQAIERLRTVVAFELMCACQALDCDPEPAPSPAVARAREIVRETVPPLEHDRPPATDVALVTETLRSGRVGEVLRATLAGSTAD